MKLFELLGKPVMESYIAYELSSASRTELEQLFPPKYPEFIGHHITHEFGVHNDHQLPIDTTSIRVVGYADDGESIEALVVDIDRNSTRPDGKTYHITWSLDRTKGRKPVDSNKLISAPRSIDFEALISFAIL